MSNTLPCNLIYKEYIKDAVKLGDQQRSPHRQVSDFYSRVYCACL